ncbi:hypothetical protein MAHJHV63_50020 [Mycobacterium avium subsp. hominissuis]
MWSGRWSFWPTPGRPAGATAPAGLPGVGQKDHRPDNTYGYPEALADGVVRPVVFLAYSVEALAA